METNIRTEAHFTVLMISGEVDLYTHRVQESRFLNILAITKIC